MKQVMKRLAVLNSSKSCFLAQTVSEGCASFKLMCLLRVFIGFHHLIK